MKGLANTFQPQFPFKGIVAAMAQMGFNPRTLFANNEPGVWYDPSDLSTLFQDAAGTTPVTGVEQPVGLMLDKSRSLGPNLAPSTGSLSGWTLIQTGGSVTVVDGGLFLNTTGTGIVAASFGGLTSSARYLFEFEVVSVSGLMYLEYGTGGAGKYLTPGKHRWCVTDRITFYLRNAGAASTSGSLLIKNVVVRAAPGSHAVQATTTARPLLSARYNILTDTSFTSTAEWGMGNWVFSGGEADPFGGTAAAKVQMGGGSAQAPARIIGPVVGDVVFRVWWNAGNQVTAILAARNDTTATMLGTVSCDTAAVTGSNVTGRIIRQQNGFNLVELRTVGFPPGNTLRIYVGGTGGVPAGTHSFWYGPDLRLVCDADEGPTYQYVAPAAASYEVAGFSPYLRFDGVDDWLVTNTITPGIDKAQVFAGVRKLSNAATGMVAELSANSGANNGTVAMYSTTSPGYAGRSRGTTSADPSVSSIASPDTAIVAVVADISADQAILRRNGSQVSSSTADQGTGNYLAYPLYIGRRGGTSVPFNGCLYSLIVRFGSNLPAATIEKTEKYINTKTRAY